MGTMGNRPSSWITHIQFPTLRKVVWQDYQNLRRRYDLGIRHILPFLIWCTAAYVEAHPDKAQIAADAAKKE